MCDTCGKELSNIRALAKHKKWHDDQENTTCSKCGVQFDDKISYRQTNMHSFKILLYIDTSGLVSSVMFLIMNSYH